MSAAEDLSGRRILIVEDDYYLASDAQRALHLDGAEIVGPFPNESMALSAIATQHICAALVDINLGAGVSFSTAQALRVRGVPVLFLTGHDQIVIPDVFGDVQRIEKPADMDHVVRAVRDLCRAN